MGKNNAWNDGMAITLVLYPDIDSNSTFIKPFHALLLIDSRHRMCKPMILGIIMTWRILCSLNKSYHDVKSGTCHIERITYRY